VGEVIEDAPSYDFVCLCCGARNGEKSRTCTLFKYVSPHGDVNSEEFQLGLTRWLASDDYKGSIIVPEDYPLPDDYRERIVEMTESFRRSHTGILLFGLPGVTLPAHTVSLAQFLN
jgi:hypothetical protein